MYIDIVLHMDSNGNLNNHDDTVLSIEKSLVIEALF